MGCRKIATFVAAFGALAGVVSGGEFLPLGDEGKLPPPPTRFANAPRLGPMPERAPGLRIFGGGTKAQIVVDVSSRYLRELADELAWHLERMTGERFPVAKSATDGQSPVVELRFAADRKEREVAIVRREGNRLVLSGRGSGPSLALTYLLESIGCRYLWPGVSGKVIPRRSEVVVPALSLDRVPELELRKIRDIHSLGERYSQSVEQLGFDAKEFMARERKVFVDREGNRDFFRWHGINDLRNPDGTPAKAYRYKWGHNFMDYWDRFGAAHPDWFALQPDGTRTQTVKGRPCFCFMSEGFIAQAARDVERAFASDPRYEAQSVCLPDGGPVTSCMCEGCRRLDPVNAAPTRLLRFTPRREWFDYVALTDRTLWFYNRIAERIAAAHPGRRVCGYAYSFYEKPPVAVRPHPALVLLSAVGDYLTVEGRADVERNLAAWTSFGNPLLWRPNVLQNLKVPVPQNFARKLYCDLSAAKANGVIGTDFDCMDGQWANKGLVYYMAARAHWNPDGLDYETQLADYCRSGFGAAAKHVRAYFDELEAVDSAAAEAADPKAENVPLVQAYLARYDVDSLARHLAAAERAAAGDAESLRRIGMLKVGVECARIHQKMGALWVSSRTTPPALRELQRKFADYAAETGRDDDGMVALNPSRIAFCDFYLTSLFRELKTKGKGNVE